MSSTTTSSTTATNNFNNNNNNNDTDPEYPTPPVVDGASVYVPLKPIEAVKKQTMRNQHTLYYSFIDKDGNLSKAELNEFLKHYCICLLTSDGKSNPKWDDVMERELNGDLCVFLGNKASTSTGCKVADLPNKLKAYAEYMSKVLIYILKNKLTQDVRNDIVKDTETTKYLEYAIRDLFYFFGQKQVQSPFQGGAATIFNNLIDSINNLFDGYTPIRVTCPKTEYGCGRFIGRRKCGKSDKWYIFIHKTGGQTNNTAANNINSVINKESTSCGGARKTRRRKQRSKKRKTRMGH